MPADLNRLERVMDALRGLLIADSSADDPPWRGGLISRSAQGFWGSAGYVRTKARARDSIHSRAEINANRSLQWSPSRRDATYCLLIGNVARRSSFSIPTLCVAATWLCRLRHRREKNTISRRASHLPSASCGSRRAHGISHNDLPLRPNVVGRAPVAFTAGICALKSSPHQFGACCFSHTRL